MRHVSGSFFDRVGPLDFLARGLGTVVVVGVGVVSNQLRLIYRDDKRYLICI